MREPDKDYFLTMGIRDVHPGGHIGKALCLGLRQEKSRLSGDLKSMVSCRMGIIK